MNGKNNTHRDAVGFPFSVVVEGVEQEPPPIPKEFPESSIEVNRERAKVTFEVGSHSLPGEEHVRRSLSPDFVRDAVGNRLVDETGNPKRGEVKDDPFFGNEDGEVIAMETGLFAVIDGVGGREDGQKATMSVERVLTSSEIESEIKPFYPGGSMHEAARLWMVRLIEKINQGVYEDTVKEKGDDEDIFIPDRERRGAVAVILKLYYDNKGWPCFAYGVVGDARLYGVRDQHLVRMSNDNQTDPRVIGGMEILDETTSEDCRRILKEQAQGINQGDEKPALRPLLMNRNLVVQCLGTEKKLKTDPEIDTGLRLKKDMVFLLCSDGIYDNLSRPEMEAVLFENDDSKKAAELLVKKSREVARRDGNDRSGRGKDDDATAVVIRVSDIVSPESAPKDWSGTETTGNYDGDQFLG